ncbi:lipopolysaccharide biosynthesis protein [Methylobacterium oryzisoli]|uniref:lipopolysaccharide biosynthesis protein n=1 Tax=Methylobacterium oryzisoli TaxID=3385502 RepID=UPI00389218DB
MTAGASLSGARAAPDTGGLARSAAAVFGVRIAAAGFAFGAQALMARLMGGAEYGIFASIWVWTALLGHASTWGLSQAASRYLPVHRARGEADLARGYIAFGAALSLGAGALLAGAGAAVIVLVPGVVAAPYAAPLLVAALVLPLFALQDFCEGIARAQHWTLLAIAPPYLLRQGLIMAAMLGALALGAPPEASTAVACTLIATALALAVQAVLLAWRLRRVLPPGPRAWAWRRWMGAALPIGLIDLAGSGFAFADVLVLGFLLGPVEVGIYFAATRLLQFLAFVHYAASAVTAPRIAEADARSDRSGLQDLVRHWSRLTLLATLATGLGLLAASPLLLGLFGAGFRSALPLLAILVAGHVVAAAFGPAEDVLTMLGAERLCAAITLGLLALSIVLMLALVPVLGVAGAAVSAALAVALRGWLLAVAARQRLGLVTSAFAGGAA